MNWWQGKTLNKPYKSFLFYIFILQAALMLFEFNQVNI